ncbi:hypothetical protein P4O66_009155, partial [Electrophorus voltai]
SGQDVQRASVIVNLPSLVRQNPAETFRRVVPKVREVLHVAGADMQLAAAGSFLTVLQDDIVLIQTHTHSILQIVLLNLDHRDGVVSSAWLETLLSAIDALPKETIRQEILSPLVSKAQLSQSVAARLASCRILGKAAAKFESSVMDHTKVVVLPELVELAQDEGSTVRLAAFDTIINLLEMFDSVLVLATPPATAAPHVMLLLDFWSRAAGPPSHQAPHRTSSDSLCADQRGDHTSVSRSPLSSHPFSTDDRTRVIFPLVKTFCEKCFKADEAVLASLSYQYGKMCHGLSESLALRLVNLVSLLLMQISQFNWTVDCYDYTAQLASFTDEQHLWFLEFYKKLCCLGLQHENGHCESQPYPLELENKYALVRTNCAYNFPAMVLFADPNHFLSELYRTFSSLCHDPEISVRRTAAEGFHEVVKLLGPNVHYVHKELIILLQDDSLEIMDFLVWSVLAQVLDALLNHLQDTLELATSRGEGTGPESKQVNVPELVPALVAAEQKAASSLRWRVHEKLLQRYSCLPRVITGDQIYFRFLQRMFGIITTNSVLPVQREAARTLCMFLRYNRKQEQRQEIISKITQELAQGRSYWNRLRFLDLCEIAIDLFSKSYFCKYFLIQALELVSDPVANVRPMPLCPCSGADSKSPSCAFGRYKLCHMLPRLRSTIRLPADKHLLQQLEFCVRKLLCREKDKDVVATVRKTVLELDKMDITEPYHKRHERDLLDQKKEKEENLLLEMELLERQQSEAKLAGEKHTDKKRRDSKTSLSGSKGMSGSTSGATLSTSAGKEMRRAKLARSRSLSSHPSTPKMANSDKTLKVKESGSCPGSGKSSIIPINDDTLRPHHFNVASSSSSLSPTPSTSSMPVLIRSNTSSNGSKDIQSRKLTIQRKSNSFGMQSGRE